MYIIYHFLLPAQHTNYSTPTQPKKEELAKAKWAMDKIKAIKGDLDDYGSIIIS